MWTVGGGHGGGGSSCWLCQGLVRATCLRGSWIIGDRWRWCPVVLPGAACCRGWGVQIVQMSCLIRASWMRTAALWCHCQYSRSRLSGV